MYTIDKFFDLFDFPYDRERFNRHLLRGSSAVKDVVRKSDTVSGAFNELSDEDKKKVVDSFNSVQRTFDRLFGIKTEPYTAEDFAGATVSIKTSGDTSGSDECKCKKEGKKCECAQKQDPNAGFATIADALLNELSTQKDERDVLIQKFVDYVVSVLQPRDGKKEYVLKPKTPYNEACTEFYVTHPESGYTDEEWKQFKKLAMEDSAFFGKLEEEVNKKLGSHGIHLELVNNKNFKVTILLTKSEK